MTHAGTIFAYGQTGTGKSFTMEGRDDPPDLRGIIPSTFNYVFDTILQHSKWQQLTRSLVLQGRQPAPQPHAGGFTSTRLLGAPACYQQRHMTCPASTPLNTHAPALSALQCSRLSGVPAGGAQEFLVRASYLEIYNEEIRDLLSKNPQARLDLKEHPERGVYVKDLMQFVVKSVSEISSVLQVCCWQGAGMGVGNQQLGKHGVQLSFRPLSHTSAVWGVGTRVCTRGHSDVCVAVTLQVGKKNRVVGATLMNQDSSRSHSIFTITIDATDRFNPADPGVALQPADRQATPCSAALLSRTIPVRRRMMPRLTPCAVGGLLCCATCSACSCSYQGISHPCWQAQLGGPGR